MRFTSLSFMVLIALSSPALAQDYTITMNPDGFSPAELVIPANEKVKVRVINANATPAEFESHELKREKIIGGKSEAIVFIGPLEPGVYEYFDEFRPDAQKGKVVVK